MKHGFKTMSQKTPRLLSSSDEGGGDVDVEKAKHLQLSGVVKSVHARLRKKFKEGSWFSGVRINGNSTGI